MRAMTAKASMIYFNDKQSNAIVIGLVAYVPIDEIIICLTTWKILLIFIFKCELLHLLSLVATWDIYFLCFSSSTNWFPRKIIAHCFMVSMKPVEVGLHYQLLTHDAFKTAALHKRMLFFAIRRVLMMDTWKMCKDKKGDKSSYNRF